MTSARFTLVLLTLAACSDSTPPEQTELEAAQATWQAESPSSYSFTWQRHCECTVETTRPMHIEVTDGEITSAIYLDDETIVGTEIRATLLTIDGVFATIEAAIDEGAHAITVEYDATLGHPVSVAVDYDERIADEELSLLIRDVTPLDTP